MENNNSSKTMVPAKQGGDAFSGPYIPCPHPPCSSFFSQWRFFSSSTV